MAGDQAQEVEAIPDLGQGQEHRREEARHAQSQSQVVVANKRHKQT